MLDHLPRPDDVEAGVHQLPRPRVGDQAQVELGVARPRAAQRLLGDVDAHHARARRRQRGREAPLAAADVQHALTRAHVLQ